MENKLSLRKLGYRPELDGLRFIAIAGVLGIHLKSKWFMGGAQGVTLFFVLSGFLITGNLIAEYKKYGDINISSFYAKRMARLYPALLVALLANIIFYSDKIGLEKILMFTIPALLYISNFYRASSIFLPGLGYTWSLSVEGQFYMVWPWVVRKLIKSSMKKITVICVFVVILLEIIRLIFVQSTNIWYPQTYYSLWSRVGAILYGAVAAIWWSKEDRKRLPAASGIAVLGLAIIVWCYIYGDDSQKIEYFLRLPIVSIGGVLLILGICEAPKGIVSRFLKLSPIVHLGQISYSIYLYNSLMIEAWTVANNNHYPENHTNTLFFLLATFAIAQLSYMFIEQPFQKWARPLINKKFSYDKIEYKQKEAV